MGYDRFGSGYAYQNPDATANGVGATLIVGVEWHLSRVRWGLFVGVGVDHFVPPDEMANYKPATLLNTFIGVEFWPPPLAPGFQMGLSVGFVAAQIPLIEGSFKVGAVTPSIHSEILGNLFFRESMDLPDLLTAQIRSAGFILAYIVQISVKLTIITSITLMF